MNPIIPALIWLGWNIASVIFTALDTLDWEVAKVRLYTEFERSSVIVISIYISHLYFLRY